MKADVVQILKTSSIAGIFHGLWHIAVQWPAEEQTRAPTKQSRERHFSSMLAAGDEAQICKELVVLAERNLDDTMPDDSCGWMLDLMSAIDGAFSKIHPRSQSSAGFMSPKPVSSWLKDYRRGRRESGSYFETQNDRVVPRGPLSKKARAKDAAYGTNLEDWFSNLGVAPVWFELRGRKIATRMKVFSKSSISGISKDAARAERISVMPLAEKSEELSITSTTRDSKKFARYEATDPPAVLEHLLALLCAEEKEGPEIAVAPEFLVDVKTANGVQERYGDVTHPPQVLVCGTGHTEDMKKDQAWNESRVINVAGIELWRQRKIWPASIDDTRAKELGLKDPQPGHTHEDNCSGMELIIADLDDLGRCIIMICQDFEATSMAEQVIRCYQPDWVFVPILDTSVDVGRWGHSRAFNLSTLSQARFVIVSSTALGDRCKSSTKTAKAAKAAKAREVSPFSLLVGPKVGEDEDSRVYRCIELPEGQATRAVELAWQPKDAGWKKTTLT
ncbi:hypothetical protein [Pseudomonas abietaniphila]